MKEAEELKLLLGKKEKLVAMVAPAFPVAYSKEELVIKLRSLGFQYVVEVSMGAVRTNTAVLNLLKKDPCARLITSPCASFVRFIRTKHPQLLKYLTLSADTPMAATAKMIKEKYPGYRPVFIGPCITKKLEASEDYPDLNILVVTFKELDKIVNETNPLLSLPSLSGEFDIGEKSTRVYPFDGGLTQSSGVRSLLKDHEIRIASGYKNCESVLKEFETNSAIRLVDVLFCEGGCINGPGVESTLSLGERKEKIQRYFSSDPDV